MERDLRDAPLYKEVEAYFAAIYEPGANWVSEGGTVTVSPDGRRAAFTGTVFHDLQSAPVTRVCLVELASGELQQVAAAANSDRLPRWSPDGGKLAFLSDRAGAGNFQLYLLQPDGSGAAHAAPVLNGTVEYFHWSPTGRYILLGLAGFGADLAGIEGGGRTVGKQDALPTWLPEIETADAEHLWRSLWVLDTETGEQRRLTREGLNPWEATWCGDAQVVAVASESHSEGSWYGAKLYLLDVQSAQDEVLYTPAEQLGWPVGSPSGVRLAFAEAVCSDRWLVCGDLFLMDLQTGRKQAIDTHQAGVVHLIWRDEEHLVYVGLREFEIVVGEVDCAQGKTSEWWSSAERTLGGGRGGYPTAWPLPHGGVVAFAEAYGIAPELVTLTANGEYRVVKSLATKASSTADFTTGAIEPVRWRARDGLELQGWVVRPAGTGPFPLVMAIHGGPVWAYRNSWHGRLRGAKVLTDHGCALFYPNPRGSSGRGQAFARLVKGDMGGEDTYDYLTGLDMLVARGIADPERLGTMGISYGGFMSAWLITQDQRFAAAVATSPVTNWYSQHRTSQIGFFDEYFQNASAYEPGGLFFARSPVMFARNVKTPTLSLAGARDQNTPPTQALEFHRSLRENGVESALALYPNGVHGLMTFPENTDPTTRTIGWFLKHMGSR
jgi:dipeptidyl aminopeptidase/acylaminoacyl peptidase